MLCFGWPADMRCVRHFVAYADRLAPEERQHLALGVSPRFQVKWNCSSPEGRQKKADPFLHNQSITGEAGFLARFLQVLSRTRKGELFPSIG